jgi:hypothetical protein
MELKLSIRAFIIMTVASLLWLPNTSWLRDAHAAEQIVGYYQPFPKGTIGVTAPMIGQKLELFWAPKLTSYQMLLDGKQVDVTWYPGDPKFIYIPENNLSAGEHKVQLTYQFEGFEEAKFNWSFTIASGAEKKLPQPAPYAENGMKAINHFREELDLAPVRWNEHLAGAALRHAEYLNENYKRDEDSGDTPRSHAQERGIQGFFGATPYERAQYYGYPFHVSEVNSIGTEHTVVGDVDMLFHAPYHRTPFMNPEMEDVGIARVGDFTVIKFGGPPEHRSETKLIISPVPDQQAVPTQWDGQERPDPLRVHQAVAPVGYPIVAAVIEEDVKSMEVLSASVQTDLGEKVNIYINDSKNDSNLDSHVFLIPKLPLDVATTYQVRLEVEVTYENSTTKHLTHAWSFTTEEKKGMWKDVRHPGIRHMASIQLDQTPSFFIVDGIRMEMREPVKLIDGSTYIHVRDLTRLLGAEVSWDDKVSAAVYEKGSRRVVLHTKENRYELNGVVHETETPAQLIEGKTMVPVRLIAEAFGSSVQYDAENRLVVIIY